MVTIYNFAVYVRAAQMQKFLVEWGYPITDEESLEMAKESLMGITTCYDLLLQENVYQNVEDAGAKLFDDWNKYQETVVTEWPMLSAFFYLGSGAKEEDDEEGKA